MKNGIWIQALGSTISQHKNNVKWGLMDERTTVRGRVEWLDSLKGILIILVVVGHFLLPVWDMGGMITDVYQLIYLFHMPLFVFVSGLLAKHAVDAHGRLRVDRILTYFLIGFAYSTLLRICEGSSLSFEALLSFPSAPWYVISLGSWMVLVPLLNSLRPAWGVTIAVLISVVSTVQDTQTDFFALSRTAHFLPFFVLGYYMSVKKLGHVREGCKRVGFAIVGAAAAVTFLLLRDAGLDSLFFLVSGNNECEMPALVAAVGYAGITLLGVGMSLGCVALSPGKSRPLSFLGKRTLQIYVIHRFVRGALVRFGFYDVTLEAGVGVPALFVVLLVISAVTCAVSSLPVFTKATNRALRLKWRPLLREGA